MDRECWGCCERALDHPTQLSPCDRHRNTAASSVPNESVTLSLRPMTAIHVQREVIVVPLWEINGEAGYVDSAVRGRECCEFLNGVSIDSTNGAAYVTWLCKGL
jgi:hypothetical protein